MIGFCIACDKPLTGKQRDYCSDKCRKRYERMAKKYPALSDKRPISDLIARETGAFVRRKSAITIIITIGYQDNGFGDINRSMDSWIIKSRFRAEITNMALNWLKREYPKWSFELLGGEVHKT